MRGLLIIAALVLTGCDKEATPEEKAVQGEREEAMVRAANAVAPPILLITPEPLLADDIQRHDLFGEACNYAPGTSLGTRVIARESDAFFKVDGEIMRLAADAGSRELPERTRTLYSGKLYSLRLGIKGEGKPTAGGAVNYEGMIEVRDSYGRVVYEGSGLAQCSG